MSFTERFAHALSRAPGRLDKYINSGLSLVHRVAGKINHAFHTARHIGRKAMHIPGVRALYGVAKTALPQIQQAEDILTKADDIQENIFETVGAVQKEYRKRREMMRGT